MRVGVSNERGHMRWRRRTRIVSTTLAVTVLTAALAGCGSSASTGTSADPAGVTPGSAPVYVGAVVRPSGSLETNALAAGSKLTHQTDPYSRLLGVLQTPGSPTLDYSHDVAPWLGPNAGLFLSSLGSSETIESLLQQGLTGGGGSAGAEWPFGAGGAQGAIALDTSDLAAAKTFVSNAAAHAGAYASSYRGVAYQATSGGDAFAVIDRFVVLGTESGVHAVIETVAGRHLAEERHAIRATAVGRPVGRAGARVREPYGVGRDARGHRRPRRHERARPAGAAERARGRPPAQRLARAVV